jgi:DNA processing protein
VLPERAYWLAWSKLQGVGPVSINNIHQYFWDLEAAWLASPQELMAVEGVGPKIANEIAAQRPTIDLTQLYEQHLADNPQFWTPSDPEYPRLLLEIPSFPPVLYYRGQPVPEENAGVTPMVAIVGTRRCTDHGLRWTARLSKALAAHGFVVVSGLAEGIDGKAHSACLDAQGRTIAVLGTGVDQIYPFHHRQLYQRIEEQGLLLSEYPQGTKPHKNNFPARNRIVAALCRAIIVIEAGERSGALITARQACEFNREVFALPNSPDLPQSRGCLKLIQDGATMITHEDELMATLGVIPALDVVEPTPSIQPLPIPADLPAPLTHILGVINYEPLPLDVIIAKTQLPGPQVSGQLLELELMGLITQVPGMRYKRSP